MAVRMSAFNAGRALPPLPGTFVVLISVRYWVNPKAIVLQERLGNLKQSNDFIEIRIRDRLACIIAPQLVTLPLALTQSIPPNIIYIISIYPPPSRSS